MCPRFGGEDEYNRKKDRAIAIELLRHRVRSEPSLGTGDETVRKTDRSVIEDIRKRVLYHAYEKVSARQIT